MTALRDLTLPVVVERWMRASKVAEVLDLSVDYIVNEWRSIPGLRRAARHVGRKNRALRFDAKEIAKMQRAARAVR